METHTRMIRNVKQGEVWLNLLTGLRGLKGINFENPISWIKIYIVMNSNLYKFDERSLLSL